MQLSIIIVNYKTPELLLQCIESIYSQTFEILFEIIVVDNHSEDNSKNVVLSKFQNVRWIDMSYNAGFSIANNMGIKSSNAEFVLLLNADTVIVDNALDKMFSFMKENSNAVAGCVQLLNKDLTPQNAGNYFVKGGLNNFLTLPTISIVIRALKNILRLKRPSVQQAESIISVDWISGAFMFVKRSVIEKSGLLDEEFFLFSEEIEWCSRLSKYGAILINPYAKVIHLEGGSMKKNLNASHETYNPLWQKKGRQLMVSHLLRIRKQYGIFWLLINLLAFWIEIPLFFVLAVFSKKYSIHQAVDYFKNVIKLSPYVFWMITKSPYFYKAI